MRPLQEQNLEVKQDGDAVIITADKTTARFLLDLAEGYNKSKADKAAEISEEDYYIWTQLHYKISALRFSIK